VDDEMARTLRENAYHRGHHSLYGMVEVLCGDLAHILALIGCDADEAVRRLERLARANRLGDSAVLAEVERLFNGAADGAATEGGGPPDR